MNEGPNTPQAETQPHLELEQIIEIRDPDIDVEQVMDRIRANVARRRAEGAYREDLNAIASEVFAGVVPDADTQSLESGVLSLTLSELDLHWMIQEQPFVSRVPIVGPVIVAIRSFWNWMSTKWYVQSLLQQQVAFNALVVRAFHEMNLEHRLLVEGMQRLEEQVERLQGENHLLSMEPGTPLGATSPDHESESGDTD